MYISGIPGIGKTASFLEEIKKLKEKYQHKIIFIHINCLKLEKPEDCYEIILRNILGVKKVNNSKANLYLENLFRYKQLPSDLEYNKIEENYKEKLEKVKIILLDEFDYLINTSNKHNQDIVYNLLEWAHCKYSRIVNIGIANTMDMPEKLNLKIQSRMGKNRIVFKAYTSDQIQEIINTRI